MRSLDIKKLWQSEGKGSEPPTLEAVRARAAAFFRQIRARNRVEYAASAFVFAAFALKAWFDTNPIVRIGDVFMIAATAYIAWQLRRRASPSPAPVAMSMTESVAHLRAEFARQRDALANVWDWYLLPFVPGFALITIGPIVLPDTQPGPSIVAGLAMVGVVGLVFYGIWRLNKSAATKLQASIDELDAMREELE